MRPVLQGKKQTKETTISINHCVFDYTRYKSNRQSIKFGALIGKNQTNEKGWNSSIF